VIRVWGCESLKCERAVDAHAKSVTSLCLSEVRGGGQSIRDNCVESPQDCHAINDLALFQDCTVMTSGSMDGSLKLWKIEEEMEMAGMLPVTTDDKGMPTASTSPSTHPPTLSPSFSSLLFGSSSPP
jgi:WD40 repeat protein